MEQIETIEQAIAWCAKYGVTVYFVDDKVNVFLNETHVGEGQTLLESVRDAELFLSSESTRSQALSDLEETEE